jgi:hypothetical protein
VVLEVLPRDQVAPYGRRIVLLAVIVGLAATAIAGLIRWGKRVTEWRYEYLILANRMAPFRMTIPAFVAITGQSVLRTP